MNFTSNATDDGTHPQRIPPREVSEDLARPSDGQNQFDEIRVEGVSGSFRFVLVALASQLVA